MSSAPPMRRSLPVGAPAERFEERGRLAGPERHAERVDGADERSGLVGGAANSVTAPPASVPERADQVDDLHRARREGTRRRRPPGSTTSSQSSSSTSAEPERGHALRRASARRRAGRARAGAACPCGWRACGCVRRTHAHVLGCQGDHQRRMAAAPPPSPGGCGAAGTSRPDPLERGLGPPAHRLALDDERAGGGDVPVGQVGRQRGAAHHRPGRVARAEEDDGRRSPQPQPGADREVVGAEVRDDLASHDVHRRRHEQVVDLVRGSAGRPRLARARRAATRRAPWPSIVQPHMFMSPMNTAGRSTGGSARRRRRV